MAPKDGLDSERDETRAGRVPDEPEPSSEPRFLPGDSEDIGHGVKDCPPEVPL